MPGSSSQYIFFNGSNYNQAGGDAPATYKNLPDFEIVGGEAEYAGDAGFSTVSTPGGGASLRTGGIISTNNIAVGIELLGSISPTGLAADGFNFNDFNIYVMVDDAPTSTVQGHVFDDTSVGLDARINNTELTPVGITLTSQNTSLLAADYVEYNVVGLGTAVAASEAANPGTNNDLVLRVFKQDGTSAVLGGISFASVPEPTGFATMFFGAAALFSLMRRPKAEPRHLRFT